MTGHAREDDAASDPDFEWVNTWAAAATAPRAPAAAPVGGPADIAGAMRSRPSDVGTASTPADPSPEITAGVPEDCDAEQAQSAVVPLETARRRKRWTHLFRIITREGETERLTEPGLSMFDAPEAPSPATGRAQDAGEGNDAEAILDLTRIERDIAEIELVRDRLLSASAPARRRTADRLASARTSDYVPILVGGVLAFTSLVVFGAAASFVSLR
ncbi:MAG: hypothetical protein ACJ8E5_19910 [Xanthobacteraceae bacterium]